MTVFLAAFDETQNAPGDFTLGGFVAPENDWKNHFEPAWRERVLATREKRPIPYLHMREIWTSEWQEEHDISGSDAYTCVEEAVSVIRSTGSLYPVTVGVGVPDFRTILAAPLQRMGANWEILEDPDYFCYIGFVIFVLARIHLVIPEATRVNFLIEHSEKTTENIKGFHEQMQEVLAGHPEWLTLFGDLDVGGKSSIPLQAADVFCWHRQRFEAGLLTGCHRRHYR